MLATFKELRIARNETHAEYLHQLTMRSFTNYNRPPSRREVAEAERIHQTLVDDDWKRCNELYPDLLVYYFNLIGIKRPQAHDPRLTEPDIDRPTVKRRQRAVVPREPGGMPSMPPMMGPQYPGTY